MTTMQDLANDLRKTEDSLNGLVEERGQASILINDQMKHRKDLRKELEGCVGKNNPCCVFCVTEGSEILEVVVVHWFEPVNQNPIVTITLVEVDQ